jgi:predicted RNase H-like HicB family nuclease
MEAKYTAVFKKVEDWWIGWAEELPGANTQGRTLEEARENLTEAIQLILEVNREIASRKSQGHPVVREELVVPLGSS